MGHSRLTPPTDMSAPDRERPTTPTLASTSSIRKSQSIRSSQRAGASTIRTVITSPPWARDEPPSPTDQAPVVSSFMSPPRSSISRLSHSPSVSTSTSARNQRGQDDGPSWWTFVRKGTRDSPAAPPRLRMNTQPRWPVLHPKPGKRARMMKERSMTWLSSRQASNDTQQDGEIESPEAQYGEPSNRWDLHIPLPTPSAAPFTLAHARTPGWDSPWSPRVPDQARFRVAMNGNANASNDHALQEQSKETPDPFVGRSKWYRRRKKTRYFILHNHYVPLLFRVVNITFTTAALAVAIQIRKLEMRYHVAGAVGSSPTLIIIFAPLTLLHVMFAIYLEYFGRPLGLWRTSMKLIHTLSETLFICAWSAALSLTFDNYFTALIGCGSPSSISWYNEIPRPVVDIPNLGRGEGGPADSICENQLALICLAGVGLIMYCTNLVISLFRIFEKVKYHPAALPV